jgi:hypothetical protein
VRGQSAGIYDLEQHAIHADTIGIASRLTELEKIKVIILSDGQKITSEVTKKQREILDALNICA